MRFVNRYAVIAAMVVASLGLNARVASADAFALNFLGQTLSGDTETGVITWTSAAVAGGADQLFEEQYYIQFGAGAITQINPETWRFTGPNSISIGYDITPGGCDSNTFVGCEIIINHTLSGSTEWSSTFGFLNLAGYSIYTYADFDLSGTIGDDQASYVGTGRFLQSDNLTSLVWQINETLTAVDVYNYDGDALDTPLLNRLNAVGDVVFATQMSNPTGFSIDRGLAQVPEPMSLMLFGTGLAVLAARRRRNAKKS